MENNKLTVIIPFLNEGDEIDATVNSIRSTVGMNVNILLINDNSTDKFDYEYIAKKYNTFYHFNEKRLGVAASRDLGVSMCTTPFFLLLDGHMRFYDEIWPKTIVSELEKDDRVLLCCQSKGLKKTNEGIVEEYIHEFPVGAYIDLNTLHPKWLHHSTEETEEIIDVPCVLGAAYAASKRYWIYLNGLNGLNSYGGDEAYISLKVWQEGGRCRLLKNIHVGHIYRTKQPYHSPINHFIYNNLLITDLLLPIALKKNLNQYFSTYKKTGENDSYKESIQQLIENKQQLIKLHQYNFQILSKSKSVIWQFTKQINHLPSNVNELLEHIAHTFITNYSTLRNHGIYKGTIGGIIFLCHYARFTQKEFYDDIAYKFLQSMIQESIFLNHPYNFDYGLAGIGWAIQYLQYNGLMEKDEEFLGDFDRKIMELNPEYIQDWSFNTGMSGIIFYVLSRLTQSDYKSFFTSCYVGNLYQICKQQLSRTDTIQGTYMASAYIEFIDKGKININFLDIWEFIDPRFDDVGKKMGSLGLYNGMSGLGLFYIYKIENKDIII